MKRTIIASLPRIAAVVSVVTIIATGCVRSLFRRGAPTSTSAPASSAAVPGISTSPGSVSTGPVATSSVTTGPVTTAPSANGITGAGAVLVPPLRPTTRTYDDSRGCQSLADEGWSSNCEVFSSSAGKAAWLVEYKGVGDETVPKRALLYGSTGGNHWSLALRASDDDGRAWESVAARTADVVVDGNPKALYSFALRAGNSSRALDMVESSGVVVLHLQLSRAEARLAPGGGSSIGPPPPPATGLTSTV